MITIRKMQATDRADIRNICIETASDELKSSAVVALRTYLLYANYYIRQSSSHCFIAVNKYDDVVGYVLCAPDYQEYKKSFRKNELKELREIRFKYYLMGLGSMLAQQPFAKEYPAHLHIDIIPYYQHNGIGQQLMNTLVEHLKKEKVTGVMLFVSPNNKNAINFYEKYGFKKLKGSAMGMKL